MTRGGTMVPVNSAQEFKIGDLVYFAVSVERRAESEEWLRQQGWRPSTGLSVGRR